MLWCSAVYLCIHRKSIIMCRVKYSRSSTGWQPCEPLQLHTNTPKNSFTFSFVPLTLSLPIFFFGTTARAPIAHSIHNIGSEREPVDKSSHIWNINKFTNIITCILYSGLLYMRWLRVFICLFCVCESVYLFRMWCCERRLKLRCGERRCGGVHSLQNQFFNTRSLFISGFCPV